MVAAGGSKVVPAGAVIATTGVASTVMVIMVWAVLPPLSVTVAVIVCVPVESVLAVIVRPVPSAPSRLEGQGIAAGRAPPPGALAGAPKGARAPRAEGAAAGGGVVGTARG